LDRGQAGASDHAFEFDSPDATADLFRRADLTVETDARLVDTTPLSTGGTMQRERVIAVLASPSERAAAA
jgi:hypothetical protein